MPLAPDVSLDFLAMVTENYTGADLMDLCRNAAVETIKLDRNVRTLPLAVLVFLPFLF
jgi:SpoVK/Ycf46/Vps4 family AAA+-type ATPase